LGRSVIRAFGILKKCAAPANAELGNSHPKKRVPSRSRWAGSFRLGRTTRSRQEGIRHALTGVRELAIGATAVGTGLNAPAGFAALSAHGAMVALSAALRTLAGALMKVANAAAGRGSNRIESASRNIWKVR
jgi:fumarate hydratase class II